MVGSRYYGTVWSNTSIKVTVQCIVRPNLTVKRLPRQRCKENMAWLTLPPLSNKLLRPLQSIFRSLIGYIFSSYPLLMSFLVILYVIRVGEPVDNAPLVWVLFYFSFYRTKTRVISLQLPVHAHVISSSYTAPGRRLLCSLLTVSTVPLSFTLSLHLCKKIYSK